VNKTHKNDALACRGLCGQAHTTKQTTIHDMAAGVCAALAPETVECSPSIKNIRVAIIREADSHRGGHGDPLSRYQSGCLRAVVLSYNSEDHAAPTMYHATVKNFKILETFVAPDAPVHFHADVYMPWSPGNDGNVDVGALGTVIQGMPWSLVGRSVSYDDFVALWNASTYHPERMCGSFVY
jgi:hypothetical protein